MSVPRLLRLASVVLVVVGLSVGSTLTAANIVPPSSVGMTSVPFLTDCPFEVRVRIKPNNLRRNRPNEKDVTVELRFPDGLPPEYAGADVLSVVMRLPGGAGEISPLPAGGPDTFAFLSDDVLVLVGGQNGNVTLEVAGLIGGCRFVAQETIRVRD